LAQRDVARLWTGARGQSVAAAFLGGGLSVVLPADQDALGDRLLLLDLSHVGAHSLLQGFLDKRINLGVIRPLVLHSRRAVA